MGWRLIRKVFLEEIVFGVGWNWIDGVEREEGVFSEDRFIWVKY